MNNIIEMKGMLFTGIPFFIILPAVKHPAVKR